MIVLRDADYSRLLIVLQTLLPSATRWTGTAFRSCGLRWARTDASVSGEGSRRSGSRFNARGTFRAAYVANSLRTAREEQEAYYAYAGIPLESALPLATFKVEVSIARVLDLTNPDVLKALGLAPAQVVAEWRSEHDDEGKETLTQALGRAAFDAGFEGILASSARSRGGLNIVVFPDRLQPTSRLTAVDLPP